MDPAMKILLIDDHVLLREALRGALAVVAPWLGLAAQESAAIGETPDSAQTRSDRHN
jgi:hypothetical protein